MLGKLLKYEFRATGRVMLPVMLALLILAACANVSIRLLEDAQALFLRTLGGVFLGLFTVGIFAAGILSLVLMIRRFYKNLLTDEGYLTFTLPVNVHGLIWSKLIVAAIWMIVTVIAIILASCIAAFNVDMLSSVGRALRGLFENGLPEQMAQIGLFLLEAVGVSLLAIMLECLLCYAALAIGFSFARGKWLIAIVAFFIFQIICQNVGLLSLFGVARVNLGAHGWMIRIMIGEAIGCAVFYLLTAWMLKHRLNI